MSIFIILIVLHTSLFIYIPETIEDLKSIAKLYCFSGQFIIDVLAVLPMELFSQASHGYRQRELFFLFRLNRLIKFIKVILLYMIFNVF